jgi:membrane-bound lytic murein transglycosylase A
VQGSGRIILDDGSVMRLGYDGQNGHSYVSIGRKLIDYGEMEIEQVSMQSIRTWLEAHPKGRKNLGNQSVLYLLPRDTRLRPPNCPPGAQGAPLTPGRSLAVDRAFMALGGSHLA